MPTRQCSPPKPPAPQAAAVRPSGTPPPPPGRDLASPTRTPTRCCAPGALLRPRETGTARLAGCARRPGLPAGLPLSRCSSRSASWRGGPASSWPARQLASTSAGPQRRSSSPLASRRYCGWSPPAVATGTSRLNCSSPAGLSACTSPTFSASSGCPPGARPPPSRTGSTCSISPDRPVRCGARPGGQSQPRGSGAASYVSRAKPDRSSSRSGVALLNRTINHIEVADRAIWARRQGAGIRASLSAPGSSRLPSAGSDGSYR
jgi:hypothetical protein